MEAIPLAIPPNPNTAAIKAITSAVITKDNIMVKGLK